LVDRLKKDGTLTPEAYALVKIQRRGPPGQESLTFPSYMDRWKAKIDRAYEVPYGHGMPCPYGSFTTNRSCSSHRGVVTTKNTAGTGPVLAKVWTRPADIRTTAPALIGIRSAPNRSSPSPLSMHITS